MKRRLAILGLIGVVLAAAGITFFVLRKTKPVARPSRLKAPTPPPVAIGIAGIEGTSVSLEVTPWTNFEVTATVSPDSCGRMTKSFFTYPSLLPDFAIDVDGRIIDRAPMRPDGVIKFCLPAAAIGDRNHVSFRVIPSAWASGDGSILPWGVNVTKVRSTHAPFMSYVVNIGSSSDISFVGNGFSYQEGAQGRPDHWADFQDFRWSEPGCELRIPVVPGNTHRVTLLGHVPVGFAVISKGREIARFSRPSPQFRYTFDVDAETTGNSKWFDFKLISLETMPLPSLDLRQLFWALDQIVVETRGPGGKMDFNRLPASGLADAAFGAAWAAAQSDRPALTISPAARWDLPAGYKSEPQLLQEACAVRIQDAQWVTDSITDARDSAFVAQKLIGPLSQTMLRTDEPARAGRGKYDVGIFVSRRQLEAAQARPGNAETIREATRGTCLILQKLHITARIINELQADQLGQYQCIIVPSFHFFPTADWAHLTKYVESGGNLLVPASPELIPADAELAGRLTTLFGVKPLHFDQGKRFIPMQDQWIQVWDTDWRALLEPTTAKSVIPQTEAPAAEELPRATPAVTSNPIGKGRAMLIAFDPFTQFSLYCNPQFVRLMGDVIRPLIQVPAVKIDGAPTIFPGVRFADDRVIVQLLNTARGQFDSAGLMNMANTFVFAEQIPAIGSFHISAACPREVTSLEALPARSDLKWTYTDGRLEVDVPSLEVFTMLVAHLPPSETSKLGKFSPELPEDSPLVVIHDDLQEKLSLTGSLTTPWPVEVTDRGAFLWVGGGEPQGLHFQMYATEAAKVEMIFTAGPGHGRAGKVRHLVLAENGKIAWEGTIEAEGNVPVPVDLPAGASNFQFYCTDPPTVLRHPNGDTRALVVALRRVEIVPAK